MVCPRPRPFRLTHVAPALAGLVLACASLLRAAEYTPAQLADLSLEDLLNSPVAVSSVSRRPGSVQNSAAAVTVLTQEEINRSGATSLPEVLRLVPGMDVARVDSHQWAISARGFNDLFANKLLVMMDGRSVYTSLFSGTFWDVQDTVLADVDRIEVIRGPGASLWGANAVNGVINVVTKKAANTQGLLLSQSAGTENRTATALRFGGKLGDSLHYRVFVQSTVYDNSAIFGTGFPEALIRISIPGGGTGSVGSAASPPRSTHDAWSLLHAGFRADWEPPGADRVTVQGDIYHGREDQLYQRITAGTFGSFYEADTDTVSGGNVLGRWTHTFSNQSDLTLQAYYDRSTRELAVLGESRDTADVDFQHRFVLGNRHTVVWGAGYRRISDRVRDSIEVALAPARRTTDLVSAFVQDEIALIQKKLVLTLGSRFEHNDYTGEEVQPTARILFTPDPRHTVWAAISGAVRTPSRADDDFRLTYPGVPTGALFAGSPAIIISVDGNRRFEAEKLTAFELGYRAQFTDRFGIDLALYYNRYRSLRGIVTTGGLDFSKSPVEIGVTFDNQPSAESYGGEISGNLRVNDRWRVRLDYSQLKLAVHSTSTLKLGTFGPDTLEGSNPQQQLAFRSWLDLSHGFEFDLAARWVDELPALNVPAYLGLDLRLGWRLKENIELSLAAQNLLDSSHPEFKPGVFTTQSTEVQRSIVGKVVVRF